MLELVDRDSEFAVLTRGLASARAGRGSVVLISGEAGIGKTSLAEAMVASVSREDVTILRGACYDLGTTPPYGPWRELVSDLHHLPDNPPLQTLPTWFQATDKFQNQDELFRAILSSITEISRDKPAVILLEDLHWSDQASLDLFRFVARNLQNLPILLLATYRSDEVSRDQPLFDLLPSLIREARPHRIDLSAFSEPAIEDLLNKRYVLAEQDKSELRCFLNQWGEGNPLFVDELLRSLELDGSLFVDGDCWRFRMPPHTVTPNLVQQIVDTRLTRLGEESIQAIQAAAVIGQRVSMPLWEHLVDQQHLPAALDEARAAGLLDIDKAVHQARFRHALVREAIHELTPYGFRTRLHRQIADIYINRPDPDPDVVSWHLLQAGDPRAAEWLIRAAEQADKRFASHEAFARYLDALAALEEVPSSESTRAGLLLKMARSLRFVDPERGNEYLRKAYEAARACGEQAIAATAKFNLGNNLVNLGEVQHGLSYMQDAVALMFEISDDVAEIQRWTHNLHWPRDPLYTMNGSLALLQATTGRFREAVKTAERLLDFDWRAVARSGESSQGLEAGTLNIDGFYGLGLARAALGEPEEGKLAFSLAYKQMAELDYGPYQMLVASNDLLMHHFPYDTDNLATRHRLVELIEGHLQISEGMVGYRNSSWGYEHYLVHAGRWHELRAIIENIEPSNLFDYWFTSLSARARLKWYEGDIEGAREFIAKLLKDGPATPPEEQTFFVPAEPLRIAAGIAIDEGDIDLARSWMLAHDHWMEWSEAVLGRAEGLLLWSRIHLAEGNASHARDSAALAKQRAEHPRQPMALIAIHRFLGELATKHADLDASEEHLHTSLELTKSCDIPFESALTLLSLADLESVRGTDERVLDWLTESLKICTELEAHPTLEKARRLEYSLRRGSTDFSYGLSRREREVLALIVEGLTDRQIAERLFISHRTVMRHVSHILRKLNTDSRTAAASLAVKEGLV